MRTVLAGAGAWEALCAPGEGKVLASFRNACYLAFPRGLAALVAPQVHPGPIHLKLDQPPPAPPVGTPVRVSDGWLLLSDDAVPIAGARVWRGRLPRPERFREIAELIPEVVREVAGRSLVPLEGTLRDRCRDRLRAGNVEGLAALLGGRGPGLTPAGDDALLGVLVALRTAWGPEGEGRLLAVAARAPTGTLGRSLLAWAARGQALEPIHDLLEAASRGDLPAAAEAVTALAAVGKSSGADVALGLAWGAELASGRPAGDALEPRHPAGAVGLASAAP